MIVSYRNKETEQFSLGQRVRAFESIERVGRLKLNRLEAAHALDDIAHLPGNRFERLKGGPRGAVQHSHQRPVAFVFRVG